MRRRAAAAIAIACAAAGCAPRAPPPELAASPADLLSRLRESQARVQRVRGRARVHVDSPTLKGTVTEFLAADKPDRVRLETYDFFGNLAAALVADGKRFAFYDAREKAYYRGEPTPENVSRLLPVVIPADELATILCGSAPVLAGRALAVQPQGDRVLLVVGEGAVGQRLTIGPGLVVEASRIREIVSEPGGKARQVAPAYDLDFGLFRHRGGTAFPGEVRLDAPSARVQISLRWRDDLEVNPAEDAALFVLEPPPGARVIDLEPGSPVPPLQLPVEPGGE